MKFSKLLPIVSRLCVAGHALKFSTPTRTASSVRVLFVRSSSSFSNGKESSGEPQKISRKTMADRKNVMLSSGYSMPIIGLGMWQTDDKETVVTALESALKVGYRHFDTAFCYKNEEIIGSVLHDILKRGVVKREEIFVVSKLPSNGMRPDNVEFFLRQSLKYLQLDYLDLYLIHLPVSTKRTDDDFDNLPIKDGDLLADDVDPMDTWRVMESLVDQGLIHSIGLSNFNSAQVERIYKESRIKPCNLQIECHAYLPQLELVEFCQKLNIAVTAYAPLGTPGLVDFAKKKYNVDVKLDVLLQDEVLKPLSEKYKKTPAQILLGYLVQRGLTVIPKSSNPDRIKENFEILDFTLESQDMETLKSMSKNYRYFPFNHLKGLIEHAHFPFNIPF